MISDEERTALLDRISFLEEKVKSYDTLIIRIIRVMNAHPLGRAMLKKLEVT